MRKHLLYIVFLITSLGFTTKTFAQAEQLSYICGLYMPPEYILDGQEYFTRIKEDQSVEFHSTFFSETTYRIVACSNLPNATVMFSVYDTEKNLLFTNKNHKYTPYWNFKFKSTVDCIIKVDVISSKQYVPGFVMVQIGFKN